MSPFKLLTIALRYDTSMSRAMLRALSAQPRRPVPRASSRRDAYRGLSECFRNRKSPMDRVF